VGEKKKCGALVQPHALNVILSNFHIYINGPKVPSLRMRIDDTLEKRLAPLRFAQSVLQLCELGDGLEVWRGAACGYANMLSSVRVLTLRRRTTAITNNLRLRFSKLCRLLGRSFRACSTSPRFRQCSQNRVQTLELCPNFLQVRL